MPHEQPVVDWATDFDVMDPAYVADPFPIWDELRETCPVAHTERRRGAWLLTTYADVSEAAHDIATFSSRKVGVIPPSGGGQPNLGLPYGLPPISADPPLHTWTRHLLLPWFSHTRVASLEPITRELCNRLIDGFISTGQADAAAGYAQQIPVRVIAITLGVPDTLADTFTGWVRDVLEFADDPERSARGRQGIITYLREEIERRKADPRDDLISTLVHTTQDDEPLDDGVVLGIRPWCSSRGSTRRGARLARPSGTSPPTPTTPDDSSPNQRFFPPQSKNSCAAYSPVTMARVVTADTDFHGCAMREDDRVLMNFPAANRDPEMFERADEIVLDRAVNRHVAFGAGIHRCAGSNLARMELTVAVQTWLERIPSFQLAEHQEVTWAGGQVRGPRSIPVVFS